jgi:hypothetical protein
MMKKMKTLNNISPKEWIDEISDWRHMSLKEGLVLYEDYVLIAQTTWF